MILSTEEERAEHKHLSNNHLSSCPHRDRSLLFGPQRHDPVQLLPGTDDDDDDDEGAPTAPRAPPTVIRAGLRCHRAPELGTRLRSRITRDNKTNKHTHTHTHTHTHLKQRPGPSRDEPGRAGRETLARGAPRRVEARRGQRSAVMLLPRLPVLSALLVLLLAAGRCTAAALLSRADGRLEGRSMLELVGRNPRTRTEPAAELSGHSGVRAPERERRSQQGAESHHKDPRYKEKFIKHLTGPLYFNPKCRKHFNRLYHSTRECTVPAYYKRCARLLTRLANSPRCTER